MKYYKVILGGVIIFFILFIVYVKHQSLLKEATQENKIVAININENGLISIGHDKPEARLDIKPTEDAWQEMQKIGWPVPPSANRTPSPRRGSPQAPVRAW